MFRDDDVASAVGFVDDFYDCRVDFEGARVGVPRFESAIDSHEDYFVGVFAGVRTYAVAFALIVACRQAVRNYGVSSLVVFFSRALSRLLFPLSVEVLGPLSYLWGSDSVSGEEA